MYSGQKCTWSKLQACSNILQHSCAASEGQSGAGMWDSSSKKLHSILTGKVGPRAIISFPSPAGAGDSTPFLFPPTQPPL
jgi:hypothetical protein